MKFSWFSVQDQLHLVAFNWDRVGSNAPYPTIFNKLYTFDVLRGLTVGLN